MPEGVKVAVPRLTVAWLELIPSSTTRLLPLSATYRSPVASSARPAGELRPVIGNVCWPPLAKIRTTRLLPVSDT